MLIFKVKEEEIEGITFILKEKYLVLQKVMENENNEEKLKIKKVSKVNSSVLFKSKKMVIFT